MDTKQWGTKDPEAYLASLLTGEWHNQGYVRFDREKTQWRAYTAKDLPKPTN